MVWLDRLLRGFPLAGTLQLLTTHGQRSGRGRTIAIHSQRHDGQLVICAANAGRPGRPGWLYNLRADPGITLQVGGRSVPGPAQEVVGPEAETLWAPWIAGDPNYARMAARLNTRFPLVRLVSAGDAPG